MIGMGVAALGNMGLCGLSLDTGIVYLLLCFCLRYLGMGILQMPLTDYGLSSVPPHLSGHASSMGKTADAGSIYPCAYGAAEFESDALLPGCRQYGNACGRDCCL